jgi:hypothetical protein
MERDLHLANVIFWTLVIAAVAFLVVGSIRRTRLGINAREVHCPECNAAMPVARKPTSVSQALWGGWTCQHCGTRLDKWGRRL